jgi:hypothetical protein
MGLFDSLMSGANAFAEKINPRPTKDEGMFRKLGRIPLAALGIAPRPPEPEPVQDTSAPEQPEELPVGEPPPSPSRDIPEGAQIIGQEALELYPPDSDVGKIIKNGYSIVSDPTNGSVIGFGDKFGHLMSPDEAMNPKNAEQTLQENGFHPVPENVDRFLKQNDNTAMDARELNFTGLKPMSDNVIVKSPIDTILETVWQTPILQTLAGLKAPLQILGEGFNRYESLKASLIQDAAMNPIKALTNAGKSFAGAAESEFPDASLRNSKQPELGDLFRKMGAPELVAAVGGLGLDVLTDLGLGLVSGKYLKQGLQAIKMVDRSGEATDALQLITNKFNAFKSAKATSMVKDALMGIRSTDIPGSPAFTKLERAIKGAKNLSNFDAHTAANEVDRVVQTIAKDSPTISSEMYKRIEDTIHNKKLLDSGNGLPMEIVTHLRAWRTAVDKTSAGIAEEISKVIAKNPKWAAEVSKEYSLKAGREISITDLPRVIAENEGNYVTRAYDMFQPGWVAPKPGGKVYNNAVTGLMEEYDLTVDEAFKKLDDMAETKAFHLPEREKLARTALDVNKGSFTARQQIPKYLRDFMGEIKDPVYNMRNTQRNLSDSLYKFKLFNMIDDLGLTSKELDRTLGRTVEIKSGDSLAWGSIAGKYISPELDSLLTTVKATDDVMEGAYLKALRGLKAMKTTLNPPGHVRQSLQNFGFTAGVNGVSPFDPRNFKYYFGEGGVKDILIDALRERAGKTVKNPANLEKYREMIGNTLIGTELPLEDIGGYMEKIARGVETRSADFPALKGSASEILGNISRGFKKVGKVASEAWAMEDMIVKMAAYLKKTASGMKGAEAVDEIYKFTPNYAEASRLAKYVRNSPLAMTVATPFFTFKSEAHRILLNVIREGSTSQKAWMAGTMGSRFALNTAMLAAAGNGLKDIKELYMSKPELISESLMNPLAMESGEFDINTKYIDPFNSGGIFAPLLAHAGATGVNPLDYMLDFTNFSPEFGYGSIVPDSVEALLTGRGKFGQELSTNERIMATIQGVGPSVLTNIPKVFDDTLEPEERVRRALKVVGIDTEKRDAQWIKSSVKNRLEQKIANKEDPTATIKAIDTIGFDSEKMLKQVQKKLTKGKPIEKKKPTAKDTAVAKALSSYGF